MTTDRRTVFRPRSCRARDPWPSRPRGRCTTLIEHVEGQLRDLGDEAARTLIVDTSSVGDYEQARAFYGQRGFVEEARIREFYGPGDDKVTFWKRLAD